DAIRRAPTARNVVQFGRLALFCGALFSRASLPDPFVIRADQRRFGTHFLRVAGNATFSSDYGAGFPDGSNRAFSRYFWGLSQRVGGVLIIVKRYQERA